MYKGQDKEIIEIIIFALNRLYDNLNINGAEYIVVFSYLMTPLVSETIAKRMVIEDNKSIRYMSKQNVHQNLLRKVINMIIKYIKDEMPDYFSSYFPKNQAEITDQLMAELETSDDSEEEKD